MVTGFTLTLMLIIYHLLSILLLITSLRNKVRKKRKRMRVNKIFMKRIRTKIKRSQKVIKLIIQETTLMKTKMRTSLSKRVLKLKTKELWRKRRKTNPLFVKFPLRRKRTIREIPWLIPQSTPLLTRKSTLHPILSRVLLMTKKRLSLISSILMP